MGFRLLASFLAAQVGLCTITLPVHAEPEVEVSGEARQGAEIGQAQITKDIAAFPESYQAALTALKEIHPNWVFEPFYTGLDWNTVIFKELQDGKSLVHKSLPNCVKEGAYDQGSWFYASKAVLERYMDPRNSLTENTIFQFEHLGYNAAYHTEEGLEKLLEGTFMNSSTLVPNTVMTYSFVIYAIGKHADVQTSPYHLAARIIQEQGQGNSPLISGTYPGYEGYYNYFNIGASGTTSTQVIENGLKYARDHWGKDLGDMHDQGAYNALWGGANIIADKYVKNGQNTLYLQKYNVNPNAKNALYTHQYMQNISAPTTEAKTTKNLYLSANALENSFVFWIPVYENMPAEACPMPTKSTNAVLEVPSDVTATTVKVDGKEYEGESYYDYANRRRRLVVTLPDGNAKKVALEILDPAGTLARGFYWDLQYMDTYYVATAGTAGPDPAELTNDVTLLLPEGISDSQVWIDGIAFTGKTESGKITVTAKDENAKTAMIYVYNEAGVPTDSYVWSLSYGENGYEAKQEAGLQGLLSYHGFSIRIAGKSGIRMKSGISVATREQLLGGGLDGYRLTEYGTLVMDPAKMQQYPMILGEEMVESGLAFGTQVDGAHVDDILETVDGRHRFTCVLVGLTPEQYQTEFAFRSYAKLVKDGEEVILYGPIVSKSIYSLAQHFLEKGEYPAGSSVEQFLQQLISDADKIKN